MVFSAQWRLGRDADRPIKIFANLDSHKFGDFVSSLFVVNSIAERFDHKIVTVLYRADRTFKSNLVRLLPNANCIEVAAGASHPPIDIVSPFPGSAVQADPELASWLKDERHLQDIFI